MARYALIYGILSELVIAILLVGSIALAPRGGYVHSMWFGYLVMLVALTFIFVGVKRYRDVEGGGVIRFWRALAVGLGIAAVAALAYVAVWEAYLALTHYTFMDDYAASMIRNAHAHGARGAALAKVEEEAANMRALYAQPLLRMAMTAAEIAPVGVVVALFSAALLRMPRVLPARR